MVLTGPEDAIRVYLRGGLGNQLFQYSAGRSISRTTGKRLVLDTTLLPREPDSVGRASRWPFALGALNHKGTIQGRNQPSNKASNFARYLQIQRFLGDKHPKFLIRRGIWAGEKNGYVPDEEDILKLRQINTYATSLGFPSSIEDELEQMFSQVAPESPFASKRFEEAQESDIVAVHLRLGDYVSLHETYGSLTVNYFEAAMSKARGADLWLFTEDKNAVPSDILRAINPSRVLDAADIESPLQNLALMSRCSTIVCSNSTFSWWAAFLAGNRAKVIVPIIEGRLNVHVPSMRRGGWLPIVVDL